MSKTVEMQTINCTACGATNRVSQDRVRAGVSPVCGRCKTPLTASAHPVIVNDANFANEVERSQVPVLLDMWAPWCAPCRMIAPLVEQLAGELAGRVKVAKLNVDENPQTASRFSVRSIPTLLLIKEGREVDRVVGMQSKQHILRKLQSVM